jgi:phenylacetate-coenzyme A ligase PaaK-like adenylate-forming protein
MECEAGCFHQNHAFVRVEFQSMKAQSGNAGLGRIALTTFENPWRVLIRFDVGDIVRLRPSAQPCACGRTDGMVLDATEGRAKDVTFDAHNRPVTVGQLDRAMVRVPNLLEYKLTQTAPDYYAADVVFETDEMRGSAAVRNQLRELYGAGDVLVNHVPAIAPEISGKHRLSQCDLPFSAADLFEGPMSAV